MEIEANNSGRKKKEYRTFADDDFSEDNNWKEQVAEEEDDSDYEEKKLSLAQACGLNTMNMFGTGPFITIPFVVAAVDPPGPQALIGYAIAAFACMNDSLIWAELGSMWPDSGGSYVYLRELYGRHTWGRLIAFEFVWQIMISGPMECASGFIATAQYLSYITHIYTYEHHSLIAFAMCLATVWALYREIDEVGTITLVLWAFTIAAIIFAVVAGYSAFNAEYIETPAGAFDDAGKFFISLGSAARFAVYDFTGYYDVNFVGKEVQNAAHNIPIACIATCCIVAMVFFLVDVAIIGSLEWRPEHGGYVELVASGDNSANYIMALFCETHVSEGFAIFFTIIVAITIFGSCFSFMIGLAQIPYTAAKDGYFYAFLAHEHPTMSGLQDYSLLFVGGVSTIFCFLDLGIVIEGMLTMQLLLQFMGQGWGLIQYRYWVQEQEEAGFSVPLFPIPNIIQLVIFGFIFLTTKTYFTHGVPLMEVAIGFLLFGVMMYMAWARARGFWPFDGEWNNFGNEDELDHHVVYHDCQYDTEMKTMRKKIMATEREIKALDERTVGAKHAIQDKDRKIEAQIRLLGEKEYQILSFNRKILNHEELINDALSRMQETATELSSLRETNEEIQKNIIFIDSHYNLISDESSEPQSRMRMRGTSQAPKKLSNIPVYKWEVEDVAYWWRIACPQTAQRFSHIVQDCKIAGPDLLALQEDMLEQYGMGKILAHQIISKVRNLQKKSDPTHY